MFDLEDSEIALAACQYLVKMFAIGVGDEDLSKGITGNEIDELLNALCVELVENVVEQ